MRTKGLSIKKVLVPQRRSQRLDEAVAQLIDEDFDLVEVSKQNLAAYLDPLSTYPLLSLGFPYIVPKELFERHPLALNVHPTLLPRYRGPTTGAYILMNNEQESGSTVHYMTELMDRGDIVAQSRVALTPFETLRSLQRKVYSREPDLVMEALAALENGAEVQLQDENLASEFPKKRTPADSEIDPTRPLNELFNQIRACDPDEFPAFFMMHGQKVCVRLWRPEKTQEEFDEI